MSTIEQFTLEERVSQFRTMSLPGQPKSIHMGTSYLVSDLLREVHQLRAEIVRTTGNLNSELDKWQEREAAVCPEDFSFEEVITSLRAALAAKDVLLLEMFQALAGVLGDMEHRGAIRPVVHKACEDAVSHWLEGRDAPSPKAQEPG